MEPTADSIILWIDVQPLDGARVREEPSVGLHEQPQTASSGACRVARGQDGGGDMAGHARALSERF